MKKLLSILFALAAFVTFQSCTEDLTDDGFKAKVVTLDVTNVSLDSFTANATVDYSGGSACVGSAGVYFSDKPNITKGRIMSEEIYLKNGKNNIGGPVKNYAADPATGIKMYFFEPKTTVYYRAFARIFTPDKGDQYVYGEEKSFVIPAE